MGPSARLRHYMNDDGPLILDGGLATELEAQGVNLQVRYKDISKTIYFYYEYFDLIATSPRH